MTICKSFHFDAAHRLDFLPPEHKCHRLHGHTYRVEVSLFGEVDEHGMLVDYAEIAAAWAPIDAALDHRYLNEIDGLANSTTEVLAEWIWDRLLPTFPSLLWTVRVHESSTTWAEVGR